MSPDASSRHGSGDCHRAWTRSCSAANAKVREGRQSVDVVHRGAEGSGLAVHFTATAEERQAYEAAPENHWIPTFSPEDAGLVVFSALGRWWATWLMVDEPADLGPEE